MSHLTSDLFEITELAHHGPEDLFLSLLTITGSFLILLGINAKMAILMITLLPISLCFTILQRRRMSRSSRAVKERTAGIAASIESSITGARTAKAFANEDYEIERFSESNERFKGSKGMFYSSMAIFHSGMEFITSAFNLLVIALGGYLIMKEQMNVIDLLTFSLYVATFLNPVRKLTAFVEQYTSGMAGFNRFIDIMRIKPDIVDSEIAKELTNVQGHIEFEDVTFSYDEKTNVIENINFTIPKGKITAVVGPSGGGKTTLCHLLPRFYETISGRILVDGQEIKSVTLQSLRSNIGIVSQDVFLFAGTVRENIAYGRISASEKEIIEAAKSAEIWESIEEMPEGLDTLVGERGIKLSGGQKQRISIARIFLKNPPILILDEATSALDTITERKIKESFDKLCVGRTTLVIAHRLSTVRNADEIIYLDKDGIKEQGTHEQLMKQGGLYSRL